MTVKPFPPALQKVLDNMRRLEAAQAARERAEWRATNPHEVPPLDQPPRPNCPMCGLEVTLTDDYAPECLPCGARWRFDVYGHVTDEPGWWLTEDEM